ncbi:hypothetical protein OROMI_033534 [Orobanche minor]
MRSCISDCYLALNAPLSGDSISELDTPISFSLSEEYEFELDLDKIVPDSVLPDSDVGDSGMGLKALLESEDWLHDDSMVPETQFELQGISGEGRPLLDLRGTRRRKASGGLTSVCSDQSTFDPFPHSVPAATCSNCQTAYVAPFTQLQA